MIVFLFFRLKRTALCRGTRKLSYGNCKVGWQCLHKARFNKLMLFVGCFLACECTQHLCLCAHHIHCNVTIILFTNNRNHSLLQLSHAVQCLDKIQLANVSAIFRSQSWWHFVQVMHSILHTAGICMSWYVFHCSYQHQVLTVPRFLGYLHNPDTPCWNHYTVTYCVLPFCEILGQDSLFIQK